MKLKLEEEPNRQLDDWLRWAAAYADRLDPTLTGKAPRDPWA